MSGGRKREELEAPLGVLFIFSADFCPVLQGRYEKLRISRIRWQHIVQVCPEIRPLFHPSPAFT